MIISKCMRVYYNVIEMNNKLDIMILDISS